jgi:hypothetical protein
LQPVVEAARHPPAVAQVTRLPLPSQYEPAPAWQAATAGHVQPATVALPPQTCGDAQAFVAVWTRQPDTIPQVTTVTPSEAQVVPAPAAHTDGTGGQAQVAPGKAPLHAVGAGQAFVAVLVRQPLPSSPQVSSSPVVVQSVPAAVHSLGGVGHDPQVALPAVPVHPWAHVTVPVVTRHCAASRAQVTTCVLDESQNVPALPLQRAGAAGQVQEAFGKAPPQGSFDAQVVLAD